jgi:steroid delta-isomerase-like uncharacterized protein
MDARTLIDRFLAGWSHDLASLLPIFTDDVVYVDKPLGANLQGTEALRGFAQGFFTGFPDIEFTLHSLFLQTDQRAAFEWRVTGTHTGPLLDIAATDERIDFTGVSLVEFRGGKIASAVDYWDLATLLRQIGRMPS